MPRTAAEIGMPSELRWPPAGWHVCGCTGASKWKSPKKGTPAIMLQWMTEDGNFAFEDPLFLTPKAMPRVNLVAQRVCGMDSETELPDDDKEAMRFLVRFIMDNAMGRRARVLVEEQEVKYMREDTGTLGTALRKRVAFAGYAALEPITTRTREPQGLEPLGDVRPLEEVKEDDDLPF